MKRYALIAGLFLFGTTATAAVWSAGWGSPASTSVAISTAPFLTPFAIRGVGTSGYVDDTASFTTPDGVLQHSSGWETLDVTSLGIPADAKAVELAVRGIITKGSLDSTAGIYVFARAAGAQCCLGPTGHEQFPVEGNYGNPVQGMVIQTVAFLLHDGRRDEEQVTVPLNGGKLEWAWGYNRTDSGEWPTGDALAVDLYVNGYTR